MTAIFRRWLLNHGRELMEPILISLCYRMVDMSIILATSQMMRCHGRQSRTKIYVCFYAQDYD